MASEVVEKIKAAEEKAEEIINTSKENAKKLLADAGQQITARRRDFEKKLKDEGGQMLKEAEQKAQSVTEAAKANAAAQCDKLKGGLALKKDKAVELVINEILK